MVGPRSLALFSAAVALADKESIRAAIRVARQAGATTKQMYETMLQSYLFLGFPRMLTAAACLREEIAAAVSADGDEPIKAEEVRQWYDDGLGLCKKVYGEKYELLRQRIADYSPDIFRWMILEGYGKVLSRPGLDVVTRELCSIAYLMMDNRGEQLYAHIRGARNVGASDELIRMVVEDIGDAAGEGYAVAIKLVS